MANASFDFSSYFRPDLPGPSGKWNGFPKYNFIGGNNAPEEIPVDDLIAAATSALRREGSTLATYALNSGPLGYLKLREFLVGKLGRAAGIDCTTDEILLTSGSLQGIDLVNAILLAPGDTVIIEEATYGGCLGRFARAGVTPLGIPLDEGGMRMDKLEEALADCQKKGVQARYIYVIPTVQNPTATIMSEARRAELIALATKYDVPIFEDECYSDLIWEEGRPRSIYAMDGTRRTIHIGSFSKSIAPALRVGYVVADWTVLSRMLSFKTDAGSGALEQMVLAEYCTNHFDAHVDKLNIALKARLDVLIDVLGEHFGTSAEFEVPPGGIFLWVKLPAEVDTSRLAQVAAEAGIAINAGSGWSIAGKEAKRCLRICYANPSVETIREGIALLAEVCNAEFGVPARIANLERG